MTKVAIVAVVVAMAVTAWGGEAPIQSGKAHAFACTDYTQGKVFIVSAERKVQWEYPARNCNDLWALPNGNLLFNTGWGVKEVTRDKRVVFSYESKSEIYACQRLANGNTFIGECNAGRLIEVDPAGKIVKELRLLPEGKDGGHTFMRNARKLENGNYLVAHYGQQVVREYDPAGKVVREIAAPGGPHSAIRLKNGNTLIAVGDAVKDGANVFEVDKGGKTVWQVSSDDLPGISLKFMAGLQRLPNGNTVMCNWVGHGQFGKAPHVIEVTPEKKVVWRFEDHRTMKTISSIQVLDVEGESAEAVSLFDGKSFEGWEGPAGVFRIEDGAMVGGTLKARVPRNEFMSTKKEYRDFELRVEFKVLGADPNAGVQIRSRRIPNNNEMIGYQADVGQTYWGCLYDESRRNRVLARPSVEELKKVLKLNDWNQYVIRCQGKRIQLWINGYQTVDYTEADDRIEQSGVIGVQIHSGGPSEAWYRNIVIRELAE